MFCSNCGSKLPENAKYCENCGDLVKETGNAVKADVRPIDGSYTPPAGSVEGEAATENLQPQVEIPQAPIGTPEEDICKEEYAGSEKPQESVAFAFGQAIGAGKNAFSQAVGEAKNAFSQAAGSVGGQVESASGDDASPASVSGVARMNEFLSDKRKVVLALCGAGLLVLVLFISLLAVSCSGSGKDELDASNTAFVGKTYDLTVSAHCRENLLFSCYDVEVLIDDQPIGVVEHGEDATLETQISSGNHTFSVREEGTESARFSQDFEMPEGPAEISCEFSCHSDDIDVDNFTIESLEESGIKADSKEEETDADSEKKDEEKKAGEDEMVEEKKDSEKTDASDSDKKESAEVDDASKETEKTEADPNKVKTPTSSASAADDPYEDVQKQFTDAGFTNVVVTPWYDLDSKDGGFFQGYPYEVCDVAINGELSFDEGAVYDKDAAVEIWYHMYKYDDPSITYNYYSVADLQNDFEANEMRAKENHEDELVQIEGYIVSIESNGSYITLDSTTNSFYLNGIDCWPDTDEIKASFTNYSVGDWVCIQGEITSVSGFGSYYDVEIHRFL